jgi:hypothetical protein
MTTQKCFLPMLRGVEPTEGVHLPLAFDLKLKCLRAPNGKCCRSHALSPSIDLITFIFGTSLNTLIRQ